VAASVGCSSLLDLDVEYAPSDAGSKANPRPPGGTLDGPGAADASGIAVPDANRAPQEAPSGESAMDAETLPDVASDSAPAVPSDSPAAPPIQYVQSVAGSNNYVGAIVTVPFANPVTLNDMIIMAADGMSASLNPPHDSLGNQFTQAFTVSNGAYGCWIYYAPVVTPGNDSVTVTLPNNPSGPLLDVYALEYSGVGALDGVNAQNGTTPDMHSGFVTTTTGDLIFGYGIIVSMGSTAAGTGFMARASVHSNLTEDEIFPGPGQVEATGDMTTGNAWTTMVAAFKGR
jgi:hypothetical protein